MSKYRLGALLVAGLAVAVGVGGLSWLGIPRPTITPVTPGPTAAPEATAQGAGTLHLTADPAYSTHDPLRLGYVLADGRAAPEVDAFEAETTIFLDRSLPAGSITILANDKECAPAVTIDANREVDVVLLIQSDNCTISTTGSHALGAIAHPKPRTAIGAFVVVDSVLVVRPLDPGSTMEPIRRPADENAEVLDVEIPPGRYELGLEVDGVVLTTLEIDLTRGQQFYYFVRALDPAVPRDCGNVPAAECEAAIAAAYSQPQGAGGPAAAHVTSVRVRPSRFIGGCPPFDPPRFDVFFDVREESGTIKITLGGRPDGGFYHCTY